MIRTCPKCLDYYADEALAFCLADGTPLIAVDPQSDAWREGARVIEEKERRLSGQQRRRKWRRGLMRATTMLLAAMVLYVIVMNGAVYLNPRPEEEWAADEPLSTSAATNEPNAPVPKSITGKASPTPTQWSTATPRPTATPVTTVIVRATPTPTPIIVSTPTPTVSPTPAEATCSDADKARERETIISGYGGRWRRSIEGERQKIINENTPDGAVNVEAGLGEIEYATTFIMSCRAAAVTLRYVWQVRTNVNGTIKVRPVAGGKRFACTKVAGVWLCR